MGRGPWVGVVGWGEKITRIAEIMRLILSADQAIIVGSIKK